MSLIYTSLGDEVVQITPEEAKKLLPKFGKLDDLREFIVEIDTPTLEYLVRGLGLSWNPTYHPGIHRMRLALALQKFVFPGLFPSEHKKKKSRYGDLPTSELIYVASKAGIEWDKTSNDAINRMRVIMALKASGVILDS